MINSYNTNAVHQMVFAISKSIKRGVCTAKTSLSSSAFFIMKDIPGYEGKYAVNIDGEIWSFKSKMFLKKQKNKFGYFVVRIGIYENKKTFLLHRLIAKAFIPNPDNKRTVNHINGIKTDNRVVNLEWATHSENILHAYKTGLKVIKNNHFIINHPNKGKFGKNSKSAKSIIQCDLYGNCVNKWESIIDAAKTLGINQYNISRWCNGKRKCQSGYKWYFINN